jgi:hypothetical protein
MTSISFSTSGYLNPEEVKTYGKSVQNCVDGTTVKITVYFNGIYYVAPHPSDKLRCDSCEKSYNNGMFIERRTYYVKSSQIPSL